MDGKDLSCEICGRRTDRKYCSIHQMAYENLVQSYNKWKQALGIEWEGYLEKVLNNSRAGLWVKEVCKQLIAMPIRD